MTTYTIKDLAEAFPANPNQLAKWCKNKYIPYEQKNYGVGGIRTFTEEHYEYIKHFTELVANGTRPKQAKDLTTKHFQNLKFKETK